MGNYFQYDRPLNSNEVLVALSEDTDLAEYAGLLESIDNAGRQYGFQTFALADLESSGRDLGGVLVKHLIAVLNEPNLQAAVEVIEPHLANFDTVTLATCYWSNDEFEDAAMIVEALKEKFCNRVNFLLPAFVGKRCAWLPSFEKLVDNAICDTVRVKYEAMHVSADISDMVSEYSQFFEAASRLYRERGLYHRSSSDGFFAIRCFGGPGFLVTATKTDKCALDLRRISWVHDYNATTNRLRYSGAYLPSSDSVEAATVFEALPDVRAIIHTHASRLFTRNREFASRVLVPPARYGELALGRQVVSALQKQGMNDFIIMDDHGEVFVSTEEARLEEHIKKFADFCSIAEHSSQNGV